VKFREAVRDATFEVMRRDARVFVAGIGVPDVKGIFGTTLGLAEEFGAERAFDIPLSENAIAGICVGATFRGMRPIFVHQRIDFLMLTMDQLVNHAAKWRAMFGGVQSVPLVMRAIVGRGNGPQHTQSHHGLFAHVPGLKVVVPATPHDAKGLFIAAVEDDDPVVYIEHRWLHEEDGVVPDGHYRVPIGSAAVVREGADVTIAAVGPLVGEALKAAMALDEAGIGAEVLDLRSLRPLDGDAVLASVARTGRLVVADPDWGPCGAASEVCAVVAEHGLDLLKAAPVRVTWPDSPVPSSMAIEPSFYPGARQIHAAALWACRRSRSPQLTASSVRAFEGPF
jgi:acetoin:2,6-dichlorophenolindophenol oxidoreductase subunit beta